MDRGKDGPHHRAGDRDLGQLEGDGAGMAHHAAPDPNQFQLQAGQRPVGHGLGQVDAAQEGGQVVGQRVQLQPHLVVAETFARQPRPVEGVFALLDVLFGGACSMTRPDTGNPCRTAAPCSLRGARPARVTRCAIFSLSTALAGNRMAKK